MFGKGIKEASPPTHATLLLYTNIIGTEGGGGELLPVTHINTLGIVRGEGGAAAPPPSCLCQPHTVRAVARRTRLEREDATVCVT